MNCATLTASAVQAKHISQARVAQRRKKKANNGNVSYLSPLGQLF